MGRRRKGDRLTRHSYARIDVRYRTEQGFLKAGGQSGSADLKARTQRAKEKGKAFLTFDWHGEEERGRDSYVKAALYPSISPRTTLNDQASNQIWGKMRISFVQKRFFAFLISRKVLLKSFRRVLIMFLWGWLRHK